METVKTQLVKHRYNEICGVYALQSWESHVRVEYSNGGTDQRPVWLVKIVDVAKVANAIQCYVTHPQLGADIPMEVLWFNTDKERNLIEFLTEPHDTL